MDIENLSPQEKIDLWFQQNQLPENEFEKVRDKILSKELIESSEISDQQSSKLSSVPEKNKITEEIDSMGFDNKQSNYLKKLAKVESGFRPGITNQYGYGGLYQFGKSALSTVGQTRDQYMGNTKNQHIAALTLAEKNSNGMDGFYGKTINGIKLNKYNLAAAMHLVGKGGVLDVLEGRLPDKKDGNGTSMFTYLKLFENV